MGNDMKSTTQKRNTTLHKKTYHCPKLKNLGAIPELTRGNTRGAKDGQQGWMGRHS